MRFIVDQQLPPDLVGWLLARGHTAEHVRNIGLREADDREIWSRAESDSATIITKDQDFASLRAAADAGPSIVWLRIGNAATPTLFLWLESRWSAVEASLDAGLTIIEVR